MKVTLMVHFVSAASVVPQVFAETAKSPVVETEMLVKVTAWLFVKVNLLAVLVVRSWLAFRARQVAAMPTMGAAGLIPREPRDPSSAASPKCDVVPKVLVTQ